MAQPADTGARVAPTVVFDDPAVLADRAQLQAAHDAEQAADVARKAGRDEASVLLAALEAGKATDQQVQAALAYLLRREIGL